LRVQLTKVLLKNESLCLRCRLLLHCNRFSSSLTSFLLHSSRSLIALNSLPPCLCQHGQQHAPQQPRRVRPGHQLYPSTFPHRLKRTRISASTSCQWHSHQLICPYHGYPYCPRSLLDDLGVHSRHTPGLR
jgi:hypothetical protein